MIDNDKAQEWVFEGGTLITPYEIFKIGKYRANQIAKAHNAALAAEREISKEWFDKWGKEKLLREKLEQQLLQTQTAIEQHNKSILHEDRLKDIKVDLSLLAEHDKEVARPFIDTLNKRAVEEARMLEEVCKPLVELLREAYSRLGNTAFPSLSSRIVTALAKFEGKK